MLTFHHARLWRGLIVLWMLARVEAPHRVELLDLDADPQKRPEYLAINLIGKVPVRAAYLGKLAERPPLQRAMAKDLQLAGD